MNTEIVLTERQSRPHLDSNGGGLGHYHIASVGRVAQPCTFDQNWELHNALCLPEWKREMEIERDGKNKREKERERERDKEKERKRERKKEKKGKERERKI